MSIKMGIIGAGIIASTHIETILTHSCFDLYAICDSDSRKLSEKIKKYGCARGFSNYRELLAEKPDAVLIALPHYLHCKATCEALEAGCHVLVEKPMALNIEECCTMIKTAHRNQKQLQVSEQNLFAPGAIITGKKYKRGELGRFLTGKISGLGNYFRKGRPAWFLETEKSGGGMFLNVGVHALALARTCLPGLKAISVAASTAFLPEYPVEACTTAMVRYADGGTMIFSQVGYFPVTKRIQETTHFVFENGIAFWDAGTWYLCSHNGKEVKEKFFPVENSLMPVYDNFAEAIKSKKIRYETLEVADDVAIVHAAYASAKQQREVLIEKLKMEEENIKMGVY